MSSKVGFADSLGKKVVSAGICAGCGACVAVCPNGCLRWGKRRPDLHKECTWCGFCARVCPRYDLPMSELESFVFGRERKSQEQFGIHRRIYIARATDSRVLKVCQDGGTVTALLLHALENKRIDGAVVSGVSAQKPFYPVPKLASTSEEILSCAGTRYSCSPNLLALPEAVKQGKTSVAFVGTPCQIQAVRKMQMLGMKLAADVKLLIGLMCSECFSYEGLIEKHVGEELGIDLGSIKGMNIKGRMIVTLKSGSAKTIPLAELKEYAQKSCASCRDFSSEVADLSAGGLGLEGWTCVITRTKEGENMLKSAEKTGVLKTKPIRRDEPALNLLVRLSNRKHRSKASL
ncbi:MAG: Coenzyme F420 hydrogenase/dehydrogenase, beta subunit C-terminal domain [Candidatus Bathyarchaeia archaeon]